MERFLAPAVGAAPTALLALACLAAALLLRRTRHQGIALGQRQNILAGGCFLAGLLAVAWWFGLRETLPASPKQVDAETLQRHLAGPLQAPPSGLVFDEAGLKPLGVGDRFPALSAEGWLNAAPVRSAELKADFTVIDVWNELCPVCHDAAAGLARIQEKYEARGVAFVGFTERGCEDAEAFVERHGIDWPNGWGAASLRDAAPQVFLVDREGWIVWYDQRLRYKHQPERLIRDLDAAINCALASVGG